MTAYLEQLTIYVGERVKEMVTGGIVIQETVAVVHHAPTSAENSKNDGITQDYN